MVIVVVVAVALAVSGDSSAGVDKANALWSEPSAHSAVMGAWEDAGLDPGGFAAIDTPQLGDARCERGAVSGMEVVLCQDSAGGGQSDPAAAEALIGNATGAVLRAGDMLVIVSDRHSADPHGKRLNLLLNTFRTTAANRTL